jgi:Family of unknown function (DUF5682)
MGSPTDPLHALHTRADLSAKVVYFPVRHHSPACAFHVSQLIRKLKPKAVLIEGPCDATPLIPLLLQDKTKPPVAIYTTYVKKVDDDLPTRRAAFYPFCDYSPELVALQAGKEVGATLAFIDLTFPQMVEAGRTGESSKAQSLFDERRFNTARFIAAACGKANARDHDDLWDQLFEVGHRQTSTQAFIDSVLTYCAMMRVDDTTQSLAADGTIAREAQMAHAIAHHANLVDGQIVVVTGGFHSVALPSTRPTQAPPLKIENRDALVLLTRYGFEQLDQLNGYSSGMPAPEFYQRLWEAKPDAPVIDRLFVDLGRACREKRLEISVADEIAAANQCKHLSRFRGHVSPSREDFLDAVRSCFIKGSVDTHGTIVLAIARQLLAGERVGKVPQDAGAPPLLLDFRRTCELLKLDLDKIRASTTALDLYRREHHRVTSHLFHRLTFLDVPFATRVAGPDFVGGKDLDRIQESWNYSWSPQTETTLIERSLYGSTLAEAASGLLLDRFTENQQHGQGGRSDIAPQLILHACQMGLHEFTPALLAKTHALVAGDSAFDSLASAVEQLLALQLAREPLQAHHLQGIDTLAGVAFERACFLLPQLVNTSYEQEPVMIASIIGLSQSGQSVGDSTILRDLRRNSLLQLLHTTGGNAAMRGCSAGLLWGEGVIDSPTLAKHFRGHLQSAVPGDAATFLRGLLKSAASSLWQVEELIADLHENLGSLDDDQFLGQLPLFRLALADLTPRQTDQVAKQVAAHAGVKNVTPLRTCDGTNGMTWHEAGSGGTANIAKHKT